MEKLIDYFMVLNMSWHKQDDFALLLSYSDYSKSEILINKFGYKIAPPMNDNRQIAWHWYGLWRLKKWHKGYDLFQMFKTDMTDNF